MTLARILALNLILTLLFAVTGCNDENPSSGCPAGMAGCPCDGLGNCDPGSTCNLNTNVCEADSSSDGDTDADADGDADSDADGDSDADADGDADSDADGDADSDADGDSDADADGDADSDADGDADSDADGDADSDADNDADGDADNDADGDADSDTDTDADSDTDTDADSDTDTDADADTDTDTDGDVIPPGYVTTGGWHGCAWTGVDDLQVGDVIGDPPDADTLEIATTATPQDFLNKADNENFCIEGHVGDSYDAVALLGFNLNEDAADADCSYDPNSITAVGPPEVNIQKSGVAVNIASNVSSATIRVQIQTANGGTQADERWCYDLGVTGAGSSEGVKVFAPYSEFNSKCWEASYLPENEWTGEFYNNQPISAVVFLVPGDAENATDYNFCVLGFAEGDSEADAPDGFAVDVGDQEGDCGGDGGEDANYDRKMVTVDGENYIIQNNYWGSTSGYQTLHYVNNSFEITHFGGSSQGGGVPVSFPSIYIGQNGNKALTTTKTDNLPARISEITSAQTTFSWSGSDLSDSNVTYDIWFSNDNPPFGGNEYGDAVSGFAMLWLHKPGGRQPIGSDTNVDANFCNVSWDVWVGPRGKSPDYPTLSENRPVVSYVAKGDVQNFSCDLKQMMNDSSFQNNLNSNWYLSDVFAGFEIWGGNPTGTKVNSFTIDVQK